MFDMRNVLRRRFSWILLFGALGCSEAPCAAYACINYVRLSGTFAAAGSVRSVDARLCRNDECETSRVDLEQQDFEQCERALDGVCLRVRGEELELQATWNHGDDEEPVERVRYRVELVDRATGKVLLDEAQELSAEVTREDECHRCWHAEASL